MKHILLDEDSVHVLTTPANLGGNPKCNENNSSPGEKNSSVVELSNRNNRSKMSARPTRRRIRRIELSIFLNVDDDLMFESILVDENPCLELEQNKDGNKIPSPPLQVIANRHRSKVLRDLSMLLCLYSISLISSHEYSE